MRKVTFVESTLQKRSFEYKIAGLEWIKFRPLLDFFSFIKDLFHICEFLDQFCCIFVALTRETSNKVIPVKKYEVIKALEELKMSLDTFISVVYSLLCCLQRKKKIKYQAFKVKIAENWVASTWNVNFLS